MKHISAVFKTLPGGVLLAVLLLTCLLLGCGGAPPQPTAVPRLIIYNWEDDLPQSVLDDFTAETGIQVETQTYHSSQEALESLRRGGVYDVVSLNSRYLPAAIGEGLVLPLNPARLTNFYHIDPSFRDLTFDPGNRYTVPYNWGVSGILFRRDLAGRELTRWADLWELGIERGKIALWAGTPRDSIGLTLRSLGYSANSEDPRHLEAARQRLLALRPQVVFVEDFGLGEECSPLLESGEVTAALGYALDAWRAKPNPNIHFALPQEGVVLWMENFLIPASSQNPEGAIQFLNYYLRPEVAARIAAHNSYATPNQNALPLIDAEQLNDPVIYPPPQVLQNAEILLPLSAAGEQQYTALWEEFLAGGAQ